MSLQERLHALGVRHDESARRDQAMPGREVSCAPAMVTVSWVGRVRILSLQVHPAGRVRCESLV